MKFQISNGQTDNAAKNNMFHHFMGGYIIDHPWTFLKLLSKSTGQISLTSLIPWKEIISGGLSNSVVLNIKVYHPFKLELGRYYMCPLNWWKAMRKKSLNKEIVGSITCTHLLSVNRQVSVSFRDFLRMTGNASRFLLELIYNLKWNLAKMRKTH